MAIVLPMPVQAIGRKMGKKKVLRLFDFYLDAVLYCRQNNIDMGSIVKKDFRHWYIKGVMETPGQEK